MLNKGQEQLSRKGFISSYKTINILLLCISVFDAISPVWIDLVCYLYFESSFDVDLLSFVATQKILLDIQTQHGGHPIQQTLPVPFSNRERPSLRCDRQRFALRPQHSNGRSRLVNGRQKIFFVDGLCQMVVTSRG